MESGADGRIRFLTRSADDPLALDGPNVIRNLLGSPKKISAVYVYDKRGTELFERQCETPEYYLRRVEAQLLRSHAADIVARCGFIPMVELGAGTAAKTRTLLAEYADHGRHCDYFPIDVDTQSLADTAHALAAEFPRLRIHALGSTYEAGLRALRGGHGRRLFLFLGSSIGNMELTDIDALLREIFLSGSSGDFLLLGADLDKDPAIINRAYNDSEGYGPQSTLNMLHHLNARYRGNFNVHRFRYRSDYDRCARKNQVRIESLADQQVTLAGLGLDVRFGMGELIEAEVMWKFDPEELRVLLERSGFIQVERWIEPVHRYGLFLMRRQ